MRYLLDTNALLETARPSPSPHLMARLERHRAVVCTAAVVWHELVYGVQRLPLGRRKDQLRGWMAALQAADLPILAYDHVAARLAAERRAQWEEAGRTLPSRDAQIAAIAMANDLVLVTHNTADFAGLDELQVEDWLMP